MSTYIIIAALTMGLTGSLHCAGMCGPIMLILPFQHLQGVYRYIAMLLYHFGRILVYVMLGILLFRFRDFFSPNLQQTVSIILGCFLLLAGLIQFFPLSRFRIRYPWSDWIRRRLSKMLSAPGLTNLFVAGMLNGLLPCGLVYMALSAALVSGSLPETMLFMFFFGLGTSPLLLGFSLLKSRVNQLFFARWRRYIPILFFCFGALLILRGSNLGIPYLSPQAEQQNNETRISCCHK